MIKVLIKLSMNSNLLNLKKDFCDKSILSCTNIKNKDRMSFLTTNIRDCIRNLSQVNKAGIIKGIKIGREKNKTSVIHRRHGCMHKNITESKNNTESIKKRLLELIIEFSRFNWFQDARSMYYILVYVNNQKIKILNNIYNSI